MIRFLYFMVDISQKQLVVFDLDGTLAESKLPIDQEMMALLIDLLRYRPVAIIGGGQYPRFQKQFTSVFQAPDELMKKIALFPTSGTRLYQYDGEWKLQYEELLTDQEKKKIYDAFPLAYKKINYQDPEKTYGVIIEDRGTQVSFSALGQDAPLDEKEVWRKNQDRRPELKAALDELLPEFDISIAGVTTVDITRKGINKAYGIRKMETLFQIPIAAMVFVGDALFPGGNDERARDSGIECLKTSGPTETKKIIQEWLTALHNE